MAFALLLLILTLAGVLHEAAQVWSNITVGSSISTTGGNNSWPSPSGDFAFGFCPFNSSPGLFLLAVWFDTLPDKTVVWSANRDSPVQDGSQVEFTTDGRLVLHDNKGQEAWSASAAGASYAAMLDTGNLVLVTAGSSNYSWESFAVPTDTILPTQVLPLGSSIRSQLTPTDYSSGRFTLDVQTDGDLALYPVNVETGIRYDSYWDTATNNVSTQLIFNESGYIYFALKNGSVFRLTPPGTGVPAKFYYQRAVLESDGVLRQYILRKDSSKSVSWSVLWQVPDNICTQINGQQGSGACGYNTYCKLNTTSGRPICLCLPGYSQLDPNNIFRGCKLDVPLSCDPNLQVAVLVDMPKVDFPKLAYEAMAPVSENECRDSCLRDCFCALAFFGPNIFGINACWRMKLPLANGREDASVTGKSLIKIAKVNNSALPLPHHDVPRPSREQKPLILVLSMLFGSCALLNVFLTSSILLCRHRRKVANYVMDSGNSIRSFTYRELEAATGGFKEKLGRGSFGTVYKGILGSDRTMSIAVKMLDKVVEAGEKEFRTEVSVIGQTHHKNLVRLLGYCNEGCHRLLVYEYMSHGSLASFLFGTTRPGWMQRAEMALEVARGLVYLHEECSSQIIHCDIKPQNVLLDGSLTAKISDFGLAKLLKTNQSQTSTGIRGTRGYVAAEWFKRAAITAKVDVYSFGVMLLEIICCRKSVDAELERAEEVILVDWAYNTFADGRLEELVGGEQEVMDDTRMLHRYVMVAMWCIQEEPSLRPSMKRVAMMLEGTMEVPVPPNPSFSFLD